jgi:hypothetical protein
MSKDMIKALLHVTNSIESLSRTYRKVVAQSHTFRRLLQNAQMKLREQQKALHVSHPELIKYTAHTESLSHLYATHLEYIQYLKAHCAASREGLKDPAHGDPKALEKYVDTDSRTYMKQITEYTSHMVGIMNSSTPGVLTAVLDDQIKKTKLTDPKLAARMATWGKGKGQIDESHGGVDLFGPAPVVSCLDVFHSMPLTAQSRWRGFVLEKRLEYTHNEFSGLCSGRMDATGMRG